MATEQVSLFGLIIVAGRKVAFGKINPQEACELFIRHALVQGEIFQRFAFMDHNQALVKELEELEHKTRKKDILASEDDIYLFYQSRLPRPFYDIRTFARFLKDQENDDFLRMTRQDLQKSQIEAAELARFPDQLTMPHGQFPLEYRFTPGKAVDGVTLKVPADATDLVSSHAVDKLVPGLFEEKITALIKALPKEYRVRLVPAQDTAKKIASQMPRQDKPLFSMLSAFIREHYKVLIPASAWSDDKLPDHLKMRISIRDEKDREIKSLRDLSKLGQFAAQRPAAKTDPFEKACRTYEKQGITSWDFKDLAPHITLEGKDGFVQKIFLGLQPEGENHPGPAAVQIRIKGQGSPRPRHPPPV